MRDHTGLGSRTEGALEHTITDKRTHAKVWGLLRGNFNLGDEYHIYTNAYYVSNEYDPTLSLWRLSR